MTVDINALRNSVVFAEESFVIDVQSFLHGLMEEKGMNRKDLADAMGVTKARVSQMFSSDCKNFTMRLLARACFAMGETAKLTSETRERLLAHAGALGSTALQGQSEWAFSVGGVTNDNLIAFELSSGSDRPDSLISALNKSTAVARAA